MNYEYDEEEEEIEIDPNDLIIIPENEYWKPKQEYILAYAIKLGFDIDNDPPELLKIAEKYLTIELPEGFCRAFSKKDLSLLYLNLITKVLDKETEIEDRAREEYRMLKEKLRNDENKVKIIPRKKIAPIGSKKPDKEQKIEKKGISDKLFKREVEKNKNKINDEIKPSDKKIKLDYNDNEEDEYDYSEKKYEIDSRKNKKDYNQIINKNDSEKYLMNQKDSSHLIKYFDEYDSSSEEDKKSIKPIPSKKNMNLKKEKSVENLKVSNEIENPDTIEEKKYNSINPNYQRSNKKRQNLRYDRKSLDKLNQEILSNKHKEEEENNNEISKEENNYNNNNNLNIKINNGSVNLKDIEQLKNNYLKKIKKEFKKNKIDLKDNYIKNRKIFIEDLTNHLEDENKIKIAELKEDNLKEISNYENYLKDKMKNELEKYKNILINEYNQNSEDINEDQEENDNNFDYKKRNMEIELNKFKSEIAIQKEKNKLKKEILEQKRKNEINEKLKILNQNQKIKKLNLEKQLKNKIESLTNKYNTNLNLYKTKYEIEFQKGLYNNKNTIDTNDKIIEELSQYEKNLKEEFDENINYLKDDLDKKLNKNLEEFKENINKENSEDKINKTNIELETDYFNILNEMKEDNKYQIKKIEDTIKSLFQKISNSFDEIKNKSKKDINKMISDISKKIKDTINDENYEDKQEVLINDFLSELISKKILILNKNNSFIDMAEEEYKQNKILIEYFIEIIRMISEMISEKNQKSNSMIINNDDMNDFLINEILQRINNLMEEFKYKYEDEQNNRLYPLLYDAFQKLMDLKYDNNNDYNLPFNSSRINPIINNQNVTNVNYLNYINNSVMNDTNYNNNNNYVLVSNRTINNINKKIDSLDKTIINNNILNKNQINSPREKQINNSSLYINPQTQRNNFSLNQNYTLNQSNPRINNNIFPIKEDFESNLSSRNYNNIYIPQIPNEILNNFNSENIRNYKIIIDFLINEYKQISEGQNIYYNRNNANQKLNFLKESEEYQNYNHIFEQISKQENDKNQQYLKDLESKRSVLEIIRNNCEESFNMIIRYNNKTNIINNKLEILITHIEDYNKHFNSRRNYIKYNYQTNPNIQNLFNNTFQIEKRNNNQQNILYNSFSNNYKNDRRLFYNTFSSFKNLY